MERITVVAGDGAAWAKRFWKGLLAVLAVVLVAGGVCSWCQRPAGSPVAAAASWPEPPTNIVMVADMPFGAPVRTLTVARRAPSIYLGTYVDCHVGVSPPFFDFEVERTLKGTPIQAGTTMRIAGFCREPAGRHMSHDFDAGTRGLELYDENRAHTQRQDPTDGYVRPFSGRFVFFNPASERWLVEHIERLLAYETMNHDERRELLRQWLLSGHEQLIYSAIGLVNTEPILLTMLVPELIVAATSHPSYQVWGAARTCVEKEIGRANVDHPYFDRWVHAIVEMGELAAWPWARQIAMKSLSIIRRDATGQLYDLDGITPIATLREQLCYPRGDGRCTRWHVAGGPRKAMAAWRAWYESGAYRQKPSN